MHVCWQTSCWLVQLRVQGEVPGALGMVAVVEGPTTIHAFWQFMAWVLQVTKQAVAVCDWINGVGTSGTG